MRNLRFEPSEAAGLRTRIPPSFAHVAFADRPGSGFDALRDLFRIVQQRRVPGAGAIVPLVRSAPWLARAAWWRRREHRLLCLSDTAVELHMVIEQDSRSENRITLSLERRDRYGQPLAAIDWGVSQQDEARLTRTTDFFVDFWASSSLSRLGPPPSRRRGRASQIPCSQPQRRRGLCFPDPGAAQTRL